MDRLLKLMDKFIGDPPATLTDAYARTETFIMKREALKVVVSNCKTDKDFTKLRPKEETFECK